MIKLERLKENLHQLDVFIDDPLSFTKNGKYLNFVDIPDTITVGKSHFLVGGTNFLKMGTKLKVELLDSAGNVIYTEPIDASYSQALYKPISIIVYGDTDKEVGGECTLTICAELTQYDDNGIIRNIPDQWKGLYNYRFRTKLFLDKVTSINTQPIKFYKYPSVEVSEIITPYITVSGSIQENTNIYSQSAVKINMDGTIDAKPYENASGQYITASFTSDMIGGIIRVKAHKDSTSGSIAGQPWYGLENDYTASIVDVISNQKLQTNFVPWSQSSQPPGSITYPFYHQIGNTPQGEIPQVQAIKVTADGTQTTSNYNHNTVVNNPPPPLWTPENPNTGSYYSYLAYSEVEGYDIEYISASFVETQTLKSYAKLSIKDLKTYSGDVHSIKTFVKPSSQVQEMLIGEGRLEEEKKFIQEVGLNGNNFFDVAAGDFVTQNKIDSTFSASYHALGDNVFADGTVATQPTLSFVEFPLMNGMKISGSLGGVLDYYKIESIPTMSFVAGQEYKLKCRLHASSSLETQLNEETITYTDVNKRAKLHIYISGSAFNQNHNNQDWTVHDSSDIFSNIVDVGLRAQSYKGKRIYAFKTPDEGFNSGGNSIVDTIEGNVEIDFLADKDGDGKIIMYVEVGEFTFQKLELNVSKDTGFNPSEYTFYLPIDKEIEDDVLTFGLEAFNINQEPAMLESEVMRLSTVPTDFSGGNLVVDGDSNLIVGSTFISNVAGSGIELAGVSSGFIRSVGYEGFTSASEGTGKAGFLIYSGSILPDSQDNYTGVGLELNAGADSGSLKFHAKGADSLFEVKTPTFFLGKEGANFVSGANNNIEISASDFHLTNEGSVTMSGTITATAGNIGNFQIISGKLSGSNITLDANSSAIFKTDEPENYFIDFTPGSASDASDDLRSNYYVKFGPNFGVRNDGILVASGAVIEGVLTSSDGFIANWTIGAGSIHKLSDSVFTGLSTAGDTRFFAGASALNTSGSAPFNVKSDGTITASKGNIGGWNITTGNIEKPGLFELAPTSSYVISSSNFKVSDTGELSASLIRVDGGTVGGFDITNDYITGSNLLIHKDGRLETSDFVSGVTGWQITAASGGKAEFENATIRGTLSTTTFEKEAVNAVGGQLYVANSTTISQSVTNSDTTMSVVNVTGFSDGEILVAKKVSGDGFGVEYLQVNSSSRDATKENELQGKIYVTRAVGNGTSGESGSLGDTPGAAQSYTEGQVLASTGKINTGYIRLNANPNDTTTPYMDIVERTGSGVYDVKLKARLGDLSGLSQAQLLGTSPSNAGFGLFSENVFLTGGINATYGEIGGFGIHSTDISSSAQNASGYPNLFLSSSGVISGSAVHLDGGAVGGWVLSGTTLSAGNIRFDSSANGVEVITAEGTQVVFIGDANLSTVASLTANLKENPEFDDQNITDDSHLVLTGSNSNYVGKWFISSSGVVYGSKENHAQLEDSNTGGVNGAHEQYIVFHNDGVAGGAN